MPIARTSWRLDSSMVTMRSKFPKSWDHKFARTSHKFDAAARAAALMRPSAAFRRRGSRWFRRSHISTAQNPRASTRCRMTFSPAGERQMFPMQTKRMRMGRLLSLRCPTCPMRSKSSRLLGVRRKRRGSRPGLPHRDSHLVFVEWWKRCLSLPEVFPPFRVPDSKMLMAG